MCGNQHAVGFVLVTEVSRVQNVGTKSISQSTTGYVVTKQVKRKVQGVPVPQSQVASKPGHQHARNKQTHKKQTALCLYPKRGDRNLKRTEKLKDKRLAS